MVLKLLAFAVLGSASDYPYKNAETIKSEIDDALKPGNNLNLEDCQVKAAALAGIYKKNQSEVTQKDFIFSRSDGTGGVTLILLFHGLNKNFAVGWDWTGMDQFPVLVHQLCDKYFKAGDNSNIVMQIIPVAQSIFIKTYVKLGMLMTMEFALFYFIKPMLSYLQQGKPAREINIRAMGLSMGGWLATSFTALLQNAKEGSLQVLLPLEWEDAVQCAKEMHYTVRSNPAGYFQKRQELIDHYRGGSQINTTQIKVEMVMTLNSPLHGIEPSWMPWYMELVFRILRSRGYLLPWELEPEFANKFFESLALSAPSQDSRHINVFTTEDNAIGPQGEFGDGLTCKYPNACRESTTRLPGQIWCKEEEGSNQEVCLSMANSGEEEPHQNFWCQRKTVDTCSEEYQSRLQWIVDQFPETRSRVNKILDGAPIGI